MCLSVVYIHMYVHHSMPVIYWGQRKVLDPGGQERVTDPLGLQLQVPVRYHVGAGN